MYWLKHFTIWFIVITQLITFIGCTTLEHDKKCVCDCKGANAHFECNGIHEYRHRELE